MAKSGGNNNKKERANLRKKLLENESLSEPSKVHPVPSKVHPVPSEKNFMSKERMEKREHKLSGKKRKENFSGAHVDKVGLLGSPDQKSIKGKDEKKKRKLSKKKRDQQNVNGANIIDIDQPAFVAGDSSIEPKVEGKEEKKKKKLSKKQREKQNINGGTADEIYQPGFELGLGSEKLKRTIEKAGETTNQTLASNVYEISSIDIDTSKGMKKWIKQYYDQRPGLDILQERIDEFITTHEEELERAKARIEEEGWTVVEHHKGRKKSTDAESGVAVGSVAQAAVLDKMEKKKVKDVGPDFYRFQKREAQRNEIMLLQSKFEQDKKRIQQLRSARKFRPY